MEDNALRMLAVRALGHMFAVPRPSLLVESPRLWRLWLDRSQDVDHKIRNEWLQLVPAVLAEHPDSASDLNGAWWNRF